MGRVAKLFFVLLLFLGSNSLIAQECEWLNTLGDKYSKKTIISSVATSKDNNIIVIGHFRDSLEVDTTIYLANNHLEEAGFIIKYDLDGDVLWSKSYKATTTSNHDDVEFNDLKIDNEGAIIISGGFSGFVDFGNGVTISSPQNVSYREAFIVKFDSAGIAQWATTIKPVNPTFGYLSPPIIAFDTANNIIAGMSYSFDFTFSASSIVMGISQVNDVDFCMFKYSKTGGFLWAKKYTDIGRDHITSINCDTANNIYFSGITEQGFTFGSQQLTGKGLLILKTDYLGNPVNGKLIPSKSAYSTINSHATSAVYPDGRLVLSGTFDDSLNFGNSIKIYQSGSGLRNAFIAFFDPNFNCKWALKDYPISQAELVPVGRITINNENIYLAGYLAKGQTKFGNDTLNSPTSTIYDRSAFITKIDTVKNILWSFTSPCTECINQIRAITTDKIGNAYAAGLWNDSINFFGLGKKDIKNINGTTFKYNGFIAKLTDIVIKRGNVYAGPYCAGDTITIPFTKTGSFEIGNEFIAELSDSAGNFDNTWRELGRITDTAGGIIKGVLPLFNVATGGRYRIRVKSTKPIVQSFYERDSLRLLIFSKDSADAGPDITLCSGQSVQLGTKGGSIWQWFPPYFFNNSEDTAKRFAVVTPDSTIEYRISISDSIGCGVVDTDYVKINIRAPLSMSRLDTVFICKGRPYTFSPILSGGDSTHYTLTVVARDSIFSNTPSTYITVNPDVPRRYLLFFTDSCSSISLIDTITIVPKSGVSYTGNYDTTICKGDSVAITPTVNTCDPNSVKYLWNNGLGEGDSKKLSPQVTTSYQVIAFDTINFESDTLEFTVSIIPKIEIQVSNDTTLCVGNTTTLNANTTGGDSATLSLGWSSTNSTFTANTPTINVQPKLTDTYTIVASDKCSANSDTGSVVITIRDSLKISLPFTDTTICFGNTINLPANGSGGLQSGYNFTWLLPDNTTNNSQNLVVNSNEGTFEYKALLDDGCTNYTDSALVKITVLAPLKALLSDSVNLCYGKPFTLYANATGGKSSNYSFSFINPNGIVINADSLAFVAQTTSQYKLVVTDACSNPITDTAAISIIVSPPLTQTLNTKDTTICYNTPLVLKTSVFGGKTNNYNYSWRDSSGNFLSNQPSVSFTSPSSAKFFISISDNCSTPITDSIFVNVLPKPNALFNLQDTIGCPPLNVKLFDASTSHQSLKNKWFANGSSISPLNNQYSFTKSGLYTIKLEVANSLNCFDKITKVNAIKVYPKPTTRFTTSPAYNEIDKVVFLHNQTSGANKYTWLFGNGNFLETHSKSKIEYTYKDSGIFTLQLIATNAYQCTDTATSKIVIHPPFTISIPNAFTPNGDGLNDIFTPVVSQAKEYNLKIWNRWGQALLNCDGPCSWDGTYDNTPVESDSYVYIISFLSYGNERRTVSGTVQLIR